MTAMARVLELRDAIVDTIQDTVGDRVSVFAHGGSFNLEQINRYSAKAPAVVVATIACRGIEIQGTERVADFRWVAFILARNDTGDARDEIALAMVELLMHLIGEQRWGVECAQATKKVNAANLFSAGVDAKGLALWAITWDQAIDLRGTFAQSLDDFLILFTKYDLDTTDGIDNDAEDQINLPGPP